MRADRRKIAVISLLLSLFPHRARATRRRPCRVNELAPSSGQAYYYYYCYCYHYYYYYYYSYYYYCYCYYYYYY